MTRVTCPHCGYVEEIDTSQQKLDDNKYTCSKCRVRVPTDGGGSSNTPKAPAFSENTPGEGIPWEVRQNGILVDFVKSVHMILKEPGQFFELISLEGNFGRPLLFGLIMSVVIGLLYVFWEFVFLILPSRAYSLGRFFESYTGNEIIFYSIVILVGILVENLLGSAFYHVCLELVGSGDGGFGATVRVRLYSMACGVFLAIPVVGKVIWGLAGFVVAVIGLSQVHNSSIGRVVLAIIGPYIALGILIALIAIAR